MVETHDMKTILGGIEDDWLEHMDVEYFEQVLSKIPSVGIVPPSNMILEAFRLTRFQTMKVIIIGQDPYPTPGEAHGLAFSSLEEKTPRSLIPIYKCLVNTGILDDIPETADLTNWAKQGVLLLNKALTTLSGKRRSHASEWDQYTDNLVESISTNHDGPLHFMLWGNDAKSLAGLIDEDKHYIWNQIHPSPMAQSGIKDPKKKFINCKDFKKINKLLKEDALQPINWDPTYTPTIKVHYNISHNGFDDPRSLTTWVASYKVDDHRIFVGGVILFTVNKKKMIYHDAKYAIQWVQEQMSKICKVAKCHLILSNNARLLMHQDTAAKCKPSEVVVFN